MGLMPKRVKFRKMQKGKMRGTAFRGSSLSFGEFGVKALENAWFSDRQIEAARVALMRNLKGGGKVWLRVFPDKPITKKPAETRMGKGKGDPSHWVAVVKKGKLGKLLKYVFLGLFFAISSVLYIGMESVDKKRH